MNFLDSIIWFQERFKVNDLESLTTRFEDNALRTLYISEIEFLKYGRYNEVDSTNFSDLKGRKEYLGQYLMADQIARLENGKDSTIYQLYLSALDKAKLSEDTLAVNAILKRLNWHLFRNSNELNTFEKHFEQYRKYAMDSLDKYYIYYYDIGKAMYEVDDGQRPLDSIWFEGQFRKGYEAMDSNYFNAMFEQLHSIFYSAYLDEQSLAAEYNRRAIQNYSKDTLYYSQKGINSILFNNAIIHYENEAYEQGIPLLRKVLRTERNPVFQMYGYDWLYKSYDALQKHDSAYFYFKKMVETKDNLDRLKHARDIKRIEGEFDLTEKEKELASLAEEKNTLQKNFFTLLPILGVALLVLMILYFLYTRYKNRSSKLEDEKSETLQKLDELKNIVIKNHIILKDKTKVYISDLMYIKSDDHYLHVYTSDDKNHFVRGKLSKLREELPPNFIQCQRSYIVNANFIKRVNNDSITLIDKTQIPLSRSYRNKF